MDFSSALSLLICCWNFLRVPPPPAQTSQGLPHPGWLVGQISEGNLTVCRLSWWRNFLNILHNFYKENQINTYHADVAQPGTAQDWKSCFLRDVPVQKPKGSNLWFESPGVGVCPLIGTPAWACFVHGVFKGQFLSGGV